MLSLADCLGDCLTLDDQGFPAVSTAECEDCNSSSTIICHNDQLRTTHCHNRGLMNSNARFAVVPTQNVGGNADGDCWPSNLNAAQYRNSVSNTACVNGYVKVKMWYNIRMVFRGTTTVNFEPEWRLSVVPTGSGPNFGNWQDHNASIHSWWSGQSAPDDASQSLWDGGTQFVEFEQNLACGSTLWIEQRWCLPGITAPDEQIRFLDFAFRSELEFVAMRNCTQQLAGVTLP